MISRRKPAKIQGDDKPRHLQRSALTKWKLRGPLSYAALVKPAPRSNNGPITKHPLIGAEVVFPPPSQIGGEVWTGP
jgi:hypothetical protein